MNVSELDGMKLLQMGILLDQLSIVGFQNFDLGSADSELMTSAMQLNPQLFPRVSSFLSLAGRGHTGCLTNPHRSCA